MRKSYGINYGFMLTQGQDFTEEFDLIEPGCKISVRSICMEAQVRDVVTNIYKPLQTSGDAQINLQTYGQRLTGSGFVPIVGLLPAIVDSEAPDTARRISLYQPGQLFFGPDSVVATDNIRFTLQADNSNVNQMAYDVTIVIEADIKPG